MKEPRHAKLGSKTVTTRIRNLGIMTAMDEEFRLIQQGFNFSSCREIGPRRFFTAQHEDIALTLVSSRIGKVAAAVTTSLLLHEYEVDAVLFTGVAGATDPNIRIGDIVTGMYRARDTFCRSKDNL